MTFNCRPKPRNLVSFERIPPRAPIVIKRSVGLVDEKFLGNLVKLFLHGVPPRSLYIRGPEFTPYVPQAFKARVHTFLEETSLMF